MNLADLRSVLDDHSREVIQHMPHQIHVERIHDRVVTRRARRVASWTATVVIVLAGLAAAVLTNGLVHRVDLPPTETAAPTRTIAGFPEYAHGSRVIAAKVVDLADRRVELVMIPTTLDLVFADRCTVGSAAWSSSVTDVALEAKLTINGRLFTSGTCSGGSYVRSRALTTLGVAVGKPATFVLTVTGARQGTQNASVPIPPIGSIALAVAARMPFTEYPLPPRPSGSLGPLNADLPAGCTEARCPGTLILRSDPADPTRPVERVLRWQTMRQIDMAAQTPGFLHVRINGVEVTTGEWWDYSGGGSAMYGDENGQWKKEFGLDLQPGDWVTVRIEPEYLTGEWQVVFAPVES